MADIPVLGNVLLLLVLLLAFVLVRDDVGDEFECPLGDGDDLLNGLQLFLGGVDGCVFGHDVTVVRGVGPSEGLDRKRETRSGRLDLVCM